MSLTSHRTFKKTKEIVGPIERPPVGNYTINVPFTQQFIE